MKLRIFILLCVCFVARAQTPATNQFSNLTNREALQRAVRSLRTNAPVSAAATNAPAFPPPPAFPAPPSPTVTTRTNPLPVTLPSGATMASGGTNQIDIPNPDEIVPPGLIDFRAADLNLVLSFYGELVNRTILRPSTLPAPQIVLTTKTPLTKREAVQALDAVLGMNGIAMINIGEKFVKAVPSTGGGGAGGPFVREFFADR